MVSKHAVLSANAFAHPSTIPAIRPTPRTAATNAVLRSRQGMLEPRLPRAHRLRSAAHSGVPYDRAVPRFRSHPRFSATPLKGSLLSVGSLK